MLTFFTTAKAFQGHSGVIQRNALKSWTRLHPDVEVILFGDDQGAAEICADLGLRHEEHVERHPSGFKYVNYLFEKAQAIARYDYLCYANCDIIFLYDLWQAFEKVVRWRRHFLMIGQRWDIDITAAVNFADPEQVNALQLLVRATGFRQKRHFVDYFLFSKGLYDEVPPLVIGRSWWDHWLVWKALSRRVPVIDCSSAVLAIHQNHGYAYHPQGKEGTNEDSLARQNKALAGNGNHLRFTADATYTFTQKGVIRRAPFHRFAVLTAPQLVNTLIFNTLWIRKPLGLQRKNLKKLANKLFFRLRKNRASQSSQR
jgi:hypothetical protein